ncbi:MAG: BrnT family toxin [Thiocapsa sp. C3-sup]
MSFWYYNKARKIAFDPAKNAKNRAKHGVSLASAADLEWDLLLTREDTREAYIELRWIGYAPIGRTVYCVVYAEEGDAYRIISLRSATPREVRDYARQV